MRLGIFGGSFNPVHSGHVNIAKAAIDDLGLEKLYVIPANVSPFKVDGKGMVLDGDKRLMLVRAAFNGIPRIAVDDRELARGGVSYAVDTVKEIAAENPDAEIFYIVGEDSLEGLPKWKDYDILKSLCTFKSYPRTSESSTAVREKLAAGDDLEGLVPDAVAMFLKYGISENPDGKIVSLVRAGLLRKEGYCPCRLPKVPEYFCPCEEFMSQMADPSFHGLCHCRLYLKP